MLYLRARYYNPAIQSFMSRDPWTGDVSQPQTLNGWNYVEGNPVNLVDLTGLRAFPSHCGQNSSSKRNYILCVTKYFRVDPPFQPNGKGWADFYTGVSEVLTDAGLADGALTPTYPTEMITGAPFCYLGPVPYTGPGYYETNGSIDLLSVAGEQIVYDFSSLTRNKFSYSGYLLDDDMRAGGLSFNAKVVAFGRVKGFRSWNDVDADYSGSSLFWSSGIGVSAGYTVSEGFEWGEVVVDSFDAQITTRGRYFAYGESSSVGFGDLSSGIATYTPFSKLLINRPFHNYTNRDGSVDKNLLMNHLIRGNSSPVAWWRLNNKLGPLGSKLSANLAIANKYANVYEDMNMPWSLNE